MSALNRPRPDPLTTAGGESREWHLEEHLSLFVQAFEHSPVAVAITDHRGRVEHANLRYLASCTARPEDVRGSTLDLFDEGFPDPESHRQFRACIADGQVWEGDVVSHRSGRSCFERVRIWPVKSPPGRQLRFVCARVDVSDRKYLEAELRHALKLESLGGLAAGIAHDFNNMLAAVSGNAEICQEATDDGLRSKCLAEITRAAQRAMTLVRQILRFSRKHEPDVQPFDLNALVDDLLPMLVTTFPRDVVLKTALARDLPAVRGDPGQVQQVLLNLCVNARDAMPAGGVITVRTAGAVSADIARLAPMRRPYVRLSVEDTGTGMTSEVRAKIFQPFYTTKPETRGTGLGLSLVQGIVADHEGFVDVRTAPGAGSIFDVYFPAAAVAELPMPEKELLFPPGSEHLLVADGEPAVRELLATAFGGKGYRVTTAGSATEAARQILEPGSRCDAVLLELDLPGGGALELYRGLRAARRDVPVVILGGIPGTDARAEFEGSGLCAFVPKPFKVGTVGRQLRALLDQAA